MQILLRHRRQVQPGRRVTRLFLCRRRKKLRRVARMSAFDPRESQTVQGLGVVRAQIKRGAETFFR